VTLKKRGKKKIKEGGETGDAELGSKLPPGPEERHQTSEKKEHREYGSKWSSWERGKRKKKKFWLWGHPASPDRTGKPVRNRTNG